MFSNLRIENFKSFDKLELGNLSRVNLFFGKNNCGKTTLLEAVFILSGMSNPALLHKCNQFRSFPLIQDVSLFFHGLKTENDITFFSDSDVPFFERKLNICYQKKNVKEISSTEKTSAKSSDTSIPQIDELLFEGFVNGVDGQQENINAGIKIREEKNNERITFSLHGKYVEKIKCSYYSPSISLETIIPNVLKIFSNKQETIVTDALRKIDERINDFILVDNIIMVDVGYEKRIPINLLGDGVRKFFTLVIAMYAVKDGVLLVDEIDNGLHFSTMEKFWQVLLETAELFNVQLFATTHNIDSLKGLNAILSQEKYSNFQKNVSAYKLLRHPDGTSFSLYYDFDSFSELIGSETEIR